jgi:hypothetical protein
MGERLCVRRMIEIALAGYGVYRLKKDVLGSHVEVKKISSDFCLLIIGKQSSLCKIVDMPTLISNMKSHQHATVYVQQQ